jgi:glycine/D-amino acid oxidase-like deaminating enzyme
MEPNIEHQVEGARPSIWQTTADVPAYPDLAEDLDADVCVVGAGISGLTTAYLLARDGRRVVVLDDGPVGGGETGRTTAHIATSFDDYYHEVARLHGAETARRVAESFRAGVDRVEAIVRDEAIDCDFLRLDGWWFPADDEGRALLEKERDATRDVGEPAELVADWPLRERLGGPALRFPRQAQFHALKYLAGLARAVERLGGRLFSGAHVTQVEDGSGDGPCTVTTAAGRTVRARDVVVATNTPVNDRFAIHTKQAPYRTYVVAMRVPRGAVPAGLYWDTLDSYHYVRLYDPAGAGAHDVLIVGGEDHKTGQAEEPEEERFGRLEAWARERFPVEGVEHRWSGQVMEPVDYLAFIGRNPGDRRVWIATGDSGNGMTHGTIAGILLSELIAGRESPWASVYDPSRVTLGALPEFLKENLNVAAQYADHVTPGEVDDASQILPGEGRVLRRGTHKVAAYRGEDGTLTVRSAVCTAPLLRGGLELRGEDVGLPVPRLAVRRRRHGDHGPAVAPLPEAEA